MKDELVQLIAKIILIMALLLICENCVILFIVVKWLIAH
jgi:hypothetical protein